MSNHRIDKDVDRESSKPAQPTGSTEINPLFLIDQCLATLSEDAPERQILYRIRHHLLQEGATQQQREAELKKLTTVVEKLTAPANRIGALLDLPATGLARIVVGGSEYYTNIDPRLDPAKLKIGEQVLVNEAYVLINTLGYDRNGPIVKIKETLTDGRLRIDQDPGRQGILVNRGTDLVKTALKSGDEIRLDPSQRLAIEQVESSESKTHVLEETPTVSWEHIGGQQQAIDSIRQAIEYPLLHAETFTQYKFTKPKGFLLHGPPGCGKTLIGQATARSLSELAGTQADVTHNTVPFTESSAPRPPITGGAFLHVKGPEVLNMWVGESERIIRELFAKARDRRDEELLPFIFIDEAESILGTRRAVRSYNISNTLVPMFCAELDGIASLQDVVVILASNRPDLIDPAVLRPGRIDRKIKVKRPGREEAMNILKIYLTQDLPFEESLLNDHGHDRAATCETVLRKTLDALFRRHDENRVLSVRLRNGKRETLYRQDLLSGAILASIVRRAKEQAIIRTIKGEGGGLTIADLLTACADEYREGEIIPPDDSAEEWLKLLDHHPDQVVGLSSYKQGRLEDEKPMRNII